MAAPPVGGMQYDAQGRPYFVLANGERSYVSPAAFGQAPPADTTGIFRSRPQWNQREGSWDTPIDWGNILNVAVGGGLGASGLSAAGAFGGAGGAGSTGAASSTTSLAAPTVTPTAVSSTGWLAPAASQTASSSGWIAPTAATGGFGAPQAARLGMAAAPLAMRAFRGGGNDGAGDGSGGDSSGQLALLIQLMIDKANRQTPVHEAAMQMATRMAPSGETSPQLQQGLAASRTPRQTAQTDPQVLAAIQRLMGGR